MVIVASVVQSGVVWCGVCCAVAAVTVRMLPRGRTEAQNHEGQEWWDKPLPEDSPEEEGLMV